jgi:hypothetical protein
MDFHMNRGQSETQFLSVLIHMNVTGTNVVNVPYSTAVIMSGFSSGKSVLPPGDGSNGSGTISNSEAEQLALGTRIEFEASYTLPQPVSTEWDPLSNAAKAALIRTWRTDVVIPAKLDEIEQYLQYFGAASN